MTQFEKFKFMAENGDSNAQYFLAQMYEEGIGTEIDLDEAKRWLSISANHRVISHHKKKCFCLCGINGRLRLRIKNINK